MRLFFRDKPYAIVKTEIGELGLYQSCAKDEIRIEKELNNKIIKADSYDYFKKWLKYIAHKSDYNPEDKSDLYEPTLKPDDIDKLSNPTLNNIAELIIENSDYLYKEHIRKEIKKEDGSTVSSMSYGDIIHPKKDDEDFVQYYFRLKCIQYEEMNKQMKAMASKFSNISSYSMEIDNFLKTYSDFSKQVTDQLKQQYKELQPSIESLTPFSDTAQKQINATRDLGKKLSEYHKLMDDKQARRKKEFEDEIKDIDKEFEGNMPYLGNYSVLQSLDSHKINDVDLFHLLPSFYLNDKFHILIEYLQQSNNTQTLIASEIQNSSKSSLSYSKRNFTLTIIIIFTTVISLATNIYFSIEASKQNRVNSLILEKELQNIESSINKDNNKDNIKYASHVEHRFDSLKVDIANKEEKISNLQKQIEEVRDSLSNMKSQIK